MLIERSPLFLKVAIEKILNGKNGKNFSKKEEEKRVWKNFNDNLILIEFEDLKSDYLFGILDFWPVSNGFRQFRTVLASFRRFGQGFSFGQSFSFGKRFF